jgi:hypothetical protein
MTMVIEDNERREMGARRSKLLSLVESTPVATVSKVEGIDGENITIHLSTDVNPHIIMFPVKYDAPIRYGDSVQAVYISAEEIDNGIPESSQGGWVTGNSRLKLYRKRSPLPKEFAIRLMMVSDSGQTIGEYGGIIGNEIIDVVSG